SNSAYLFCKSSSSVGQTKVKSAAKQQLLLERIKERPEITVTWFQPDAKKDGGRYIVSTGRLKRIHEADQVLILVDGLRMPIGDIVELESECIRGLL
ncbi:YolD-like family protein, partial [Anaerotruncus colihominis]|nr:YolD-like family protein [Anaerotruncus colihominis]